MSHPNETDRARIEALEVRVAYQEKTIAELNEVVTAQWRKMDALERKLARIGETVNSLQPGNEGPEPPPPHY